MRDRQNSERLLRVAVVAPARALDPAIAGLVFELAREHAPHLALRFETQCFASHGHFAGDDATRQASLVAAANDPDIDAVWFARGGYGSIRLLDGLVEKLGPAARAKTYLGYSDTSALLGVLHGARIGRCIHGPMPADMARVGGAAAVLRSLEALSGPQTGAEGAPPQAAFNLTVLAALNGTRFMPNLSGHVLHLEDIGEYHYRIDRAFAQLASSPWFANLAGVRLGRFSEIPENDIDFALTAEDIARHWCHRAGVAILGESPIGHDAANGIVVFG